MKKILLITCLGIFVNGINGQWTDSGSSITTLDNVGIGTSLPDSKLTVEGHVNVGGSGNYHLKVRHIDGKDFDSNYLSDLYLNYDNGKNVRIGFGNNNPQSNLYLSGRLGIGITNPSYHIDVRNDISPTEAFMRFRVSDSPDDYFSVVNATGAPGQFIPRMIGYRTSDNRYSIQFSGVTSTQNDTGNNALVNFDARISSGPIQNRPLFVWTTYSTKMMTMLANGNLGIGTANPDSRLAVNGNIHAQEVKVDLVGWPDYVFKEDYDLPTLDEVEKHIKEKGHLMNIPSAKEVEENGIQLGEMNKLLLEKIEELTIYLIQQQFTLDKQNIRIKHLEEILTQTNTTNNNSKK
ncbi:hypothetical protein GTQ34_16035 [Muricauda sp. JGD-17]|uniref:Endosialidase-like protein n=1 Tax=Flagellimonas ochracea TaxID=2696472 RepID=A0A964TG04_9FLAO|nr:hypothetical protein [Allomuricauda ochracea]NAY93421.1 hypothetical protein [Allomuricauda ochracea]